ncbi:MAG: hypothetical protein CME70_19360 [Halobacteriovorax sp.]|nr:hypothetical protein [Halobacteriovorax sp.]MBK26165.1 hypothetical protein [Halobacteriovorax sp.]|tara:strand:- start:780 stop:1079 length:300 start_codon:yes stop_codon:yes gene_type:complete
MKNTHDSKKQDGQKQGTPWKIIGRYQEYSAASKAKEELASSPDSKDSQFKIKRMNDPAGFVIKTRIHPDVIEKQKEKKGKKKKPQKKKSASSKNNFDKS